MKLMGIGDDEGMRPKPAIAVAADAFVEAGQKAKAKVGA